MSKTTDNFSFIDEIKHQLYLYRVKCDIALSDREEGVITQAEYHRAIERQGEINANSLIKNFEKLMLEVLPRKKLIDYRDGYKGNRVGEARSEGYNQAIDDMKQALESMLSKSRGME